VSQPLSPLAARLAAHVAAARNKRILVSELFTAAQGRDLSLVGDPAARGRFRRALEELAVVSLVTLPSAASRSGWDAIVDSPLPFASQHVPAIGPVILLVAENLATYTSFLTAARALGAATRPVLHVAWASAARLNRVS
jgi:hypothetical protein